MALRKLISDFDGIWTNQEYEAEYVWNFILKELSDLIGFSQDEVNMLLNQCRKEMSSEPWEYGWFYNGKIAAYFGEDPFGDNNAIFDYINRAASKSSHSRFRQRIYEIKQGILDKHPSLADFSEYCFREATTDFKRKGKLKPIEKANKIVKELNSSGIEIVVASNSKTEKIEHLFTKAGLKVTNESSVKRGRLHARGGAGKFKIDNNFDVLPESFHITGKFEINLRRPYYYEILKEEKPDYVLGDVFSLDIALPLWLSQNVKDFSGLRVIQKVQPHTPEWVKSYLSSKELKSKVYLVKSVEEITDLLVS
ncbi:MAG: hypothetical protein N2510_00160 [Ignavibacteria bacterium]|nr:hypothetical protein [Ignavibacteria bacterium]